MKKFILASVMIMLCICSVLLTKGAFLNAEVVVESVGISIADDKGTTIDTISDYSKDFVDLTSPYGDFTITLSVNGSSLKDLDMDIIEIINDLSLDINNTSISVNNINDVTNEYFKCELNTDNMAIKFTPLLPNTYKFQLFYKKDNVNEKKSSEFSLTTNPIPLGNVKVTFSSTQLTIIGTPQDAKYTATLNYDKMLSEVTITSSIADYEKYIDPKISKITYSWSIPKFEFNAQGETLKLSKNDILAVGNVDFTCSITFVDNSDNQVATISKIITVQIDTSNPSLSVKNDSGVTTLKSGTSNMSTELSLKLLTSEEYTAQWFRKTPNSTCYTKIKDGKSYTVEILNEAPQTNGYGIYSYIAVATTTTTNSVYVSEPMEITISPSDYVQTTKYYVKKESIPNSRSDAEAFRLTLMSESEEAIYLDQSKIVWVVVGSNTNSVIGTGLSAEFQPQTSGTYIVDVKLNMDNGESRSILTDGRIQIISTVNAAYKIILWVGISIAVMGIALTVSIIVTTKKREIIW